MGALDFCTVTASTKRNVDAGSGITTAATEYLTGLAVTPLWPLRPETVESLGIRSPREFKEAYHVPTGDTLPDIIEGDILVHGGASYPIDSVSEWTDISDGIPCLRIVVQEIKDTWSKQ